MESNMELINELFSEEEFKISDEYLNLQPKKSKYYYIGKAEDILLTLDNDNYYHFLKTILKNFKTLSNTQQEDIISLLNIKSKEKIIIKEKVIYKYKNKNKPKLNNRDDY